MLHTTLRTFAAAVIIFLLIAVGSAVPSLAEESPEESPPPEEQNVGEEEDGDWVDMMEDLFEILCPEDLDFICPDGGAKLEGDGSV